MHIFAPTALEWQSRAKRTETELQALRDEIEQLTAVAAGYLERLRHMETVASAGEALAQVPEEATEESGSAGASMTATCGSPSDLGSTAAAVIADIRKQKMVDEDIPPELCGAIEMMRGICGR